MKRVTAYLHCDKQDVCEQNDHENLSDDQKGKLVSALYEVKFLIDVDTGAILEVDDKAVAAVSRNGTIQP
jgi:hypothetical protein